MDVNRIICADALSVLKTLPDDSVDLICTDPPYGLGIAAKGTLSIKGSSAKVRSFSKSDWDTFIPTKDYFDQIMRVSKNQIIWGGNYFAHLLPPTQCWLVWWKKDGLPRGTFSDCELAWTSFKKPAMVYNSRWHGFIRDSKEDRIAHPTQKALDVMRWCIEEFSSPKDLVADPFLGSGTIAVAAHQLGRTYLGIEMNAEYVKIAEKRLAEVRVPLLSTPQVYENKASAQLL